RHPRAAALGCRPRADLRGRRGGLAALPLLGLQPRPGAGLRHPRGSRRRLAVARAVAVVREAPARARRARAATEPPTATGTRAGVQDPRTPEPTETEEALSSPRVREDAVELTLPDPGRAHRQVVLGQEIVRPRPGPAFEWRDGVWRLEFGRPDVDRLEYLIGVDGAFAPDPANPRRAGNPFGDKSVIEWPEYTPPEWLDSIADAGPVEPFEIRSRRLVARVPVLLYATPDPPAVDAPLLVVHDGPEYAQYAGLTRFLDVMSWQEHIPP